MRFEHQDIGPRLREGQYLAKVFEIDERDSSNGNPMVVARLAIEDGGYPGEEIHDYFVIDGQNQRAARIGRRRLASLCAQAGLEVTPGRNLDLQELFGRAVTIDVREDTLDGLPVARVRAYRKPRQPLPF